METEEDLLSEKWTIGIQEEMRTIDLSCITL